jgi:hypothetical protein
MDETDFLGKNDLDILQSDFNQRGPRKADIQAAVDAGAVSAKRAKRFLRAYRSS